MFVKCQSQKLHSTPVLMNQLTIILRTAVDCAQLPRHAGGRRDQYRTLIRWVRAGTCKSRRIY